MIFKYDEINIQELGDGVSRKILAHGGKIMAVEVTFEKGGIGQPHRHEHEQVSYVLEGKFKVTIEGKESVLTKGDTFYVGPDLKHGVEALEDGKLLDIFTPQREDFMKR